MSAACRAVHGPRGAPMGLPAPSSVSLALMFPLVAREKWKILTLPRSRPPSPAPRHSVGQPFRPKIAKRVQTGQNSKSVSQKQPCVSPESRSRRYYFASVPRKHTCAASHPCAAQQRQTRLCLGAGRVVSRRTRARLAPRRAKRFSLLSSPSRPTARSPVGYASPGPRAPSRRRSCWVFSQQ